MRTSDLEDKEAVLTMGRKGFFTISHFDGFAAVLVQLRAVAKTPLREALGGRLAGLCATAAGRAFLGEV